MDIRAYIESGIIESYVLGLASSEEMVELEAMCMQYPEVKQAVDDFATLIEKQAIQESIMPPAEIKQQLMDRLSDEFEAPKVVAMPSSEAKADDVKVIKMRPTASWRYVAAAAIVLLIVSASLNVYYYDNYKTASHQYNALLLDRNSLQANSDKYQTKYNGLQQSINILEDSAMRVVKLPAMPGKPESLATVYWNSKTKDVYLFANNLAQTPDGKQYQLWAIVDGKPVDAGLISDCDGVCKMKNIPNAQAFAITLENTGGSPTPHLDALVVMGKI